MHVANYGAIAIHADTPLKTVAPSDRYIGAISPHSSVAAR